MDDIILTATSGINLNSPASPAASAAAPDAADNFWGEDGFSFGDILDLINPLQHIPIIGTIYRAITGDQISNGASIIGGFLFGGFLGVGAAVVNAIIEEVTGDGIGEHMMAMLDGEETPSADDAPAPAVLASAESHDDYDDGAAPAREAMGSDTAPHGPMTAAATAAMTTLAAPASAESSDAFNAAYGRRAQEATLTSLAPINGNPAAPAPAAATPPGAKTPDGAAPTLAARPVIEPIILALATPAAQGAPRAENPPPMAPLNPAWLTATPRAASNLAAAAMSSMTPGAWLQLVQSITENPESQLTRGSRENTRDVIERYVHQAMAAKTMATEPGIVDILY